MLRSAYASAIQLAIENGCTSLAFPAISTGIYGYPLEEACKEAANVCGQRLSAPAWGSSSSRLMARQPIAFVIIFQLGSALKVLMVFV